MPNQTDSLGIPVTPEEFEQDLSNIIDRTKSLLLQVKSAEYSFNNDRMHNFKKVQSLFSLIKNKDSALFPSYALMSKQFISVTDIINGDLEPTEFIINEKFGDVVNYFILMWSQALRALPVKELEATKEATSIDVATTVIETTPFTQNVHNTPSWSSTTSTPNPWIPTPDSTPKEFKFINDVGNI